MMSSAALSTSKSSIVWRQSLLSSKQSSNESPPSTGLRPSETPRAVDSVWKDDTEWVEDVEERRERCDRGVRFAGVREWV